MKRRIWTEDELSVLKDRYHNTTAGDLAKIFGRSVSSIHGKAAQSGLRKDPEFLREMRRIQSNHPAIRATQFKPGSIPQNKGKKMSAEVYERCKGTMFKPGNTPKNHMEVGTEVLRGDGYIWRKIAEPNKWKLVHRILWEEQNGPVPKGFIVSFKNKNQQDIRLENLYLISRSEQLVKENSMMARYPEELRSVIRVKAAIKRKINKIDHENEEHKS